MEYTKGEWRPTAFSIYVDNKRILDAVVNDGNTEFARVAIPELQANIELCAAAPDMYEALKLYQSHQQGTSGHYCWQCAEVINKAIAKAEGK